jgi:hypothetical protein
MALLTRRLEVCALRMSDKELQIAPALWAILRCTVARHVAGEAIDGRSDTPTRPEKRPRQITLTVPGRPSLCFGAAVECFSPLLAMSEDSSPASR